MAENQDQSVNAFVLPTWFVRISAGIIALSVPWFVWCTVTLVRIDVRLQHVGDSAEQRETRIDALNDRILRHLQDPDIHRPAIRLIEQRLDRIAQRLDGIEKTLNRRPNE